MTSYVKIGMNKLIYGQVVEQIVMTLKYEPESLK